MHPVEIARLQFKAAAGEATGVELSIRMLADKVPELRAFAHSKNSKTLRTRLSSISAIYSPTKTKRFFRFASASETKFFIVTSKPRGTSLTNWGCRQKRGVVRRGTISPSMSAEEIQRTIRAIAEGHGEN